DTGPLRRDLIPMYMLGWAPDYIDPENYITPLYSNTSAIWVNTYDYELEQLMLAGETTVDITTRKAIYNEIQQKLLEELYFFAWISVGKNYDVYQDYVKGWVPNAIYRLDFHSVYIDITTISMVQSLNYGTIVDPTDLDPHLSYDTAGWNVISQICEGLYKFNFTDPASSLVPVLATALPTVSPDGLNITIPLRTGVKFQDGTNFNATAAKWNFDRVNYFLNYSGNQYLTSPFNVPLPATSQLTKVYSLFTYGGIPIINRTEVIGPYIIRIVLNMPKASIINLLAFPSTLMQSPTSAQIQGKELDYLTYADGDVLIGTGPFILQNYQEDVQVKFIGNPNYWQGAPQLTNLTFWTIEDDIALNTAVLAGDIDLYDSPGISFLDQFRNDPYTTLLEAGPTVNTNYMGFNGYMVNTTFRKAISYAINYSYLIDVVLEGRGYRLKSPIPTGIPMSNYSFNYPIFDRAYAQSIMQSIGFGTSFTTDAQWLAVAAGGGWGFGWNITVQTEGTTRRDLALYISDCLKYLGIDAPVVQVPFWNLIECMMDLAPFSREMIPMYMLGWAPDYYDPENYITPLFSNISAIWVNTYDYELEQLILAGETTVDIAAREIIYNQIQKKLVEELYFHVWISTGKNYDVYQNHVHGWVPNTHNRLDFYSIYIEEEYWILNPIIIDDTGGGDFTWAQAVSQSWCNGSGTSSDPYVIEKIKINGKDSESCIDIRNSDVHFIIKNSVFYNSGDSNYDAGIRLENISNGTLFNNNCSNNNGNGIALINCINNTISGNIVYQNNYAGIVLSSSNKSIVSGNTVYLNNLHGISIEDSIMNEISGNTAYNNSYNGIFLTYCNNSRILGNTIYNNYQNGIYVWYSNYSIISENTAYNHPWKGIRLEYSKNNDVIGNVVYESIEDGIYLYYSDENQISGNNAYDNLNGIYLWVSNDNNLIKNTLYNNDDNGIGLYDCDNTFIIGNILNMNGLNPYYASLGNNNFFRWNLADGYTDPIVFDDAGGGDFTWVEAKNQLAWFSGSGTGIDPYIIENIIVNGQNSGSCIEIINSNAYLIIRNCKFTNSGSGTSDAGIKLVYVTAAATEIINVDCSYNNGYGIYLTYCQGINIRNCIINNNARDGIALFNSNNNYIEYNDNTVNYNNGNGIFLNSSHYNEINNNIINYNSVGIYFNGSNYNTISFNDLQFNTIEAVVLKGVCIGNIFSDNNPPISIGGDGDGDGEFPLWIIILVIVGIIALVAIGGGVLVLKKRSTKPRKVEEEELIVGATLKEEKKLEKNRQKIEAKEKKIERDLQKKMSFVDYLIKEGKYRMALKNLNEIQEKAQASKLTELENRSKERRKLCEKLFEEKIEQEKLKEEERKEEVRLKTEKKLEKERLKEEEKREQIKKVLRIKISDLDYLIQENMIDLAIENLVKIQKEAQAQVLTDIVKEIEEKIISYKKSKLEIVNRIKQIILNLGAKFTRLQLIDISEKSGIKDEALIENVIQEMIKNKEIQGEYFSSSKALAIEVVSPVPVVEKEGLYHVFISYSTLDTEYFQISKIVRHLELYPEIKKVLFWEADSKQNIVEFMEETLKKTNAFVLFCSENSMKSEAVKGEWQAAYQMVKKGLMKMIPVYENEDHIPRLLWQMLNIKYTKDNFEEFIQKLYEEILR
ncbi:MAG: ABC transporter substrate-binding protein, partial [Candidatus Hermodarchaeota archaeon]